MFLTKMNSRFRYDSLLYSIIPLHVLHDILEIIQIDLIIVFVKS